MAAWHQLAEAARGRADGGLRGFDTALSLRCD